MKKKKKPIQEEAEVVVLPEDDQGDGETAAEVSNETSVERERHRPSRLRVAMIVLGAAWLLLILFAAGFGILQAIERKEQSRDEERHRPLTYGQVVDTSTEMYTYEEMEADLKELCRLYPDRARMASAGTSADGREIWYLDIGDKRASRQIFVSAGIHGREYLTPLLAMKMAEYYLANYNTEGEEGVAFVDVAGDCLFRVVPMVNPDGVAISQQGMEGIRSEDLRTLVASIYEADREYESYRDSYADREEYLKHWKANARGVDLNRNFPIAYWAEMKTGIGHPSSQKYKGYAAGSEPETQAVMKLIEELSDPACVISLHSQGEILYWDCGQEGAVRTENEKLVKKIGALTGYEVINRFVSPDATLDDWATLEQGIPAVTIETGKGSVPLEHEQFEGIWNQTKDLWMILAEQYGG